MTKRLTAKSVEQAMPGAARREVPDGLLPGLFLIIQPSGRKSWCVRYRHPHARTTRKCTLGPFPALDLAAAREAGAAALRAVAQGRDPAGEKQSAKVKPFPVDTVEAALDRFVVVHAKRNMRRRSAQEVERVMRKIAARWRGRRLADIAPPDLIELLDTMIETPIMANRALAYVKMFFNWCRARGMVTTSPADGIKRPHKERARERTLSDHELFRIWRASEQLDPVLRGVLRILILTGQRRREVSAMRWHELDLREARWVLPGERVKNGRQHAVPLSTSVLDILSKIPRVADCPFVFTRDGKVAIADLDRPKRRLDQIIAADGGQPLVPWVLHDVRRSVATGMARIGIQVPVVERALNHVSGSFRGITGTYQRHSFAEKCRPRSMPGRATSKRSPAASQPR
jgi:integrase